MQSVSWVASNMSIIPQIWTCGIHWFPYGKRDGWVIHIIIHLNRAFTAGLRVITHVFVCQIVMVQWFLLAIILLAQAFLSFGLPIISIACCRVAWDIPLICSALTLLEVMIRLNLKSFMTDLMILYVFWKMPIHHPTMTHYNTVVNCGEMLRHQNRLQLWGRQY